MDFRNLLNGVLSSHIGNLADSQWADMIAGKKKPNDPPIMSLTPGQQAMVDTHTGMAETQNGRIGTTTAPPMTVAPLPVGDAPEADDANPGGGKSKTKALASGLGGVSKVLNAPGSPITPVQMGNSSQYQNAINQAINSAPLPMMQGGGVIPVGGAAYVGDGGDGSGTELVENTPQGAQVIPLAQQANQPIQPNPQAQALVNGQPTADNQGGQAVAPTVATPQTLGQSNPVSSVASQPITPAAQAAQPTQPAVAMSPLDRQIADLQQQQIDRMQKLKPSSKWADLGARLVQGADNYFNPRNAQPIQSLDAIRYNRQVAPVQQKLAGLQAQKMAAARAVYESSQAKRNQSYSDYLEGRNQTTLDAAGIKDAGLTQRSQARDIMQQYNHMPTFDATDPDNADFVAAAKAAHVAVPSKSGKTSYKYITDEKTGKTYVDISDQSGTRHLQEVTNDDGTPFSATTKSMMTASDKAEQRDLQEKLANQSNITKVKVAEIGAGSRRDVANINQSGAGDRQRASQTFQIGQAANHSADQARQTLAAIDNADKNPRTGHTYTDAERQAAKDTYLKSLKPEVRKQLQQ